MEYNIGVFVNGQKRQQLIKRGSGVHELWAAESNVVPAIVI